jgi:hypothetical protein
MAENQTVDNQVVEGAGGQPSAPVSQQGGGSINDERLQEFLRSEIQKSLKPVMDEVRGVQGRQDKDRTAMREILDEFKKQKAKGLTDTEAEHAAATAIKERTEAQEQKELLSKIAEKLGLSAGGTGAASIDLKNFPELSAGDPEVVANVLSLTDPREAELAALRMIRKRSSVTPQPSAASPVIGTPPPAEDLMAQYKKQSQGLRGNALIELKMQFRRKGLDIN